MTKFYIFITRIFFQNIGIRRSKDELPYYINKDSVARYKPRSTKTNELASRIVKVDEDPNAGQRRNSAIKMKPDTIRKLIKIFNVFDIKFLDIWFDSLDSQFLSHFQ